MNIIIEKLHSDGHFWVLMTLGLSICQIRTLTRHLKECLQRETLQDSKMADHC